MSGSDYYYDPYNDAYSQAPATPVEAANREKDASVFGNVIAGIFGAAGSAYGAFQTADAQRAAAKTNALVSARVQSNAISSNNSKTKVAIVIAAVVLVVIVVLAFVFRRGGK